MVLQETFAEIGRIYDVQLKRNRKIWIENLLNET